MKFSVLMSIYKNESPEYFQRAMESVLTQTLPPDEIVLVRDGEVPQELQTVIDGYTQNPIVKYCPLAQNVGLGNALNEGLKQVSHEIVARMDTDDICAPERFEKQIKFLEENPKVVLVGGQITEFIGEESNVLTVREVPCTDAEIRNFIKTRNPFNHQTVTFRKSAVDAVGGYVELHFLEDYYLWCRMCVHGGEFANLPEVLVNVRTGEDLYKRRGGWKYFKNYRRLENYKKKSGIIGGFKRFKNLCLRFAQSCTPNFVRKWGYNHLARKKAKK
ncbi:MAG: glycosyltransferase [Clostridia bacterium]|nr:glycosyltransferase [Clostridia bacterium]